MVQVRARIALHEHALEREEIDDGQHAVLIEVRRVTRAPEDLQRDVVDRRLDELSGGRARDGEGRIDVDAVRALIGDAAS